MFISKEALRGVRVVLQSLRPLFQSALQLRAAWVKIAPRAASAPLGSQAALEKPR